MGADEIHARTVCGLYRRACAEVLVVRTGNPCAYFRSISPIAQVKKPRRSTTTSAFFDLHSRKNILRNMHRDFRYGLLALERKENGVYFENK